MPRALSLEDRDGHVGVIVTTDLIGLTAAIADAGCERLAADRAEAEQILLSSSHIHTGLP